MLALLFFFLDFLCFAYFKQWLVSSLLIFIAHKQSVSQNNYYSFQYFWFPIILLLFQDCFLHTRFGLALVYLVPMLLIAYFFRPLLFNAPKTLPLVLIIFAISTESILVNWLILGKNISVLSTIIKIFTNIVIEYTVLLGMRGNRPLAKIIVRGRKVWTPNRKDAS